MSTKLIAVIRIRGVNGVRPKARYSMLQLGLTRKHHCVLVNEKHKGEINACKDYVTWGEPSLETVAALIEKRGMISAKKPLKSNLPKGFSTVQALAESVFDGTVSLQKLGVKKIFRLSPARKGFGSIKAPFPKGALGYRGEKINELISKML